MIQSKFNNELGVLEVIYSGAIFLEELLQHGNNIANNFSLPRKLNILTDAREAVYKFGPEKINQIIDALKENLEDYALVKNAFIYSTPNETAYSVYLESEKEPDHYEHGVFSTREDALYWLIGK